MVIIQKKLSYYQGITLFETTVTMIITSIVMVTSSAFISSAMSLVNQKTEQSKEINKSMMLENNNIVYVLLSNDFTNNKGNISLNNSGDNLRFIIPNPNNFNNTANVQYDCNLNTKQLTRKVSGFNQEVILDNVESCYFAINTSTSNSIITLNYSITYKDNDNYLVISNSINGPYVK